MASRVLTALLALTLLAVPATAAPRADAKARAWVADVVNRIGAADRGVAPGQGGPVTLRVRIAADGALGGIAIEEGAPALAERARRAAEAAGPFAPPPPNLLTLEGYTELSFPLTLR